MGPCEIQRLRASLPERVLLVLDEAYAEYLSAALQGAGIALARAFNNVVVTRTFSEAYVLAALRLGWMFDPEMIVDGVHRIRGAFNVTSTAQAAGLAALEDTSHLAAVVAHNDRWRPELLRQLADLDVPVPPSFGNFVLATFESWHGTTTSEIAGTFDKWASAWCHGFPRSRETVESS